MISLSSYNVSIIEAIVIYSCRIHCSIGSSLFGCRNHKYYKAAFIKVKNVMEFLSCVAQKILFKKQCNTDILNACNFFPFNYGIHSLGNDKT